MRRTIFMIMVLGLFLVPNTWAYDDGDFQVWNTDAEEFHINDGSRITLEEEFRWGDNAGEFYYHHYDIGFFYDFQEWMKAGGGYRQVYELKDGKFKIENAPYVIATFNSDYKGFKVEDRSRLEYRHFDYKDDSWRYRNKVALKLPWKFSVAEIQPYFVDEVFVEFSGASEFNRNRFFSGLKMNIVKDLKGEIYYMLQCSKGSDGWADTNVLGVKLKLAF